MGLWFKGFEAPKIGFIPIKNYKRHQSGNFMKTSIIQTSMKFPFKWRKWCNTKSYEPIIRTDDSKSVTADEVTSFRHDLQSKPSTVSYYLSYKDCISQILMALKKILTVVVDCQKCWLPCSVLLNLKDLGLHIFKESGKLVAA